MNPIKVLIVDEDILVRRAITTILQEYKVFNVCWMSDKFHSIEDVIRKNSPDVVMLSIDHLEADAFTILTMIRIQFPELPVIVIVPRSDQGAEVAIAALRLGAIDFITRPAHKNLILFAEKHLEKRLGSTLKAAKNCRQGELWSEEILESLALTQKTFEQIEQESAVYNKAEIVVIGGCTGGVETLFAVLPKLPADLKVPIIIVQHLPRIFSKHFAQKLDMVSDVTVREVQDGVAAEKADVWIAQGGYHCEIALSGYQKVLCNHRGLRENNMRPSIDILFRSAARIYGEKTLGILLSGYGYDGLAGAQEIVDRGGQIIVQDPRSAIAPDLPIAAIKKGISRNYYTPEMLADQIVRRVTEISGSNILEKEKVVSVEDNITL